MLNLLHSGFRGFRELGDLGGLGFRARGVGPPQGAMRAGPDVSSTDDGCPTACACANAEALLSV